MFFCVVKKPLKWFGDLGMAPPRCWINPTPRRAKRWFCNRFNDLFIIQFYIIKPMQFHEFDVFVFECSFLSVEIKNSLRPTIP